MTMEGNGTPVTFKISISGVISQEINQIKKEAQDKGLAQEVQNALQVILARLRTNPLEFGEVIRRFDHLNLIVHVAASPPLFVRFAIHEEAKFVIIMKIQFLS
jgi:hypothetical protein